MARRASSSAHPLWLTAAFVLVLAFAGGGYWIYSQLNDPFRTLTPFPVSAYLENSDSLRGNTYSIRGTIANQLGWSLKGRLYSIDIGADVLPVLIPAEFNAVNLQKGQQFSLEIEVSDKGILQAKALRKV